MTPEPEAITQEEYNAFALWRYTLRHFLRFSEEETRKEGSTPLQYQLLIALKALPTAPTVDELAKHLQMKRHGLVSLLNRAQGQGLVYRVGDKVDRRQKYVHLSPQGDALLLRLALAHREELRRLKEAFEVVFALPFWGEPPYDEQRGD